MKLKYVHRVLEFEQECWVEPYIWMNTEFTKNAKSDFETTFYKLTNNSVFGKTMENLRNRVDIKIVYSKWDRQNKMLGYRSFVLKAYYVFKWPGRNRHAQKQAHSNQTCLHRDDHPWQQQDPDVWFFLQQAKKDNTAQGASSCTQTRTAFCLRSKRMTTKTPNQTKICMTQATTWKGIHLNQAPTKRF